MGREQEERLAELLEKLRRNKEKIPEEVLRTRYRDAYARLVADVMDAARAYALPIAAALPDWAGGRINKRYAGRIAGEFDRIYREGGYAHKIGRALFKAYSIGEVRRLSLEINREFQEAVSEAFQEAVCVYAASESLDPDSPAAPKIYNDLADKFYDTDAGEWRDPEPGEHGGALLIFIRNGRRDRQD